LFEHFIDLLHLQASLCRLGPVLNLSDLSIRPGLSCSQAPHAHVPIPPPHRPGGLS
jgi:hypothetical protein